MPYAVELFLREADASPIDAFWAWENDQGLGSFMDGRPHVTLGVWDTFDVAAVSAWLARFAGQTSPFPVVFASIGVFPNHPSVLFLAPVVTTALTNLQATVIDGIPADPNTLWGNYRDGRWIPHCTLGMRLDMEACFETLRVAKDLPLPIDGVLDRIAIVEIPDVVNHLTVPLGE